MKTYLYPRPSRPEHHRFLAFKGQVMPPLETPMPMVKHLPQKEFSSLLGELCPLTGMLKHEPKQTR